MSKTLNGKNLFWVVRATDMDINPLYYLFNSYPTKRKIEYNHSYEIYWESIHGRHFLKEKTAEKFLDIGFDDEPVPVKLVITDSENSDFYIERYGNNLFMDNKKISCFKRVLRKNKFIRFFTKYKWIESEMVSHDRRISNKLFPEITEDKGIVGIKLERI